MDKDVKRFSRVLRVRQTERDISQSELAEVEAEEARIRESVKAADEKKESALEDFCAPRSGTFSPQELWFERRNLDLLAEKLEKSRLELESCRLEVEEKKSELLEKHRRVQLMGRHVERLKERSWQLELKEEQKSLDDTVTMRVARRDREDSR